MNLKPMSLEELIRTLPPQLHAQVKTYAEYLMAKQLAIPKKPRRLLQDWADELENDVNTYTSHK